MTDHQGHDSIIQCRIEARRLLKQLRSAKPEDAAFAAGRFRQLRSFSDVAGNDVRYLRERVQLKHALAFVAQERGYESWTALKIACERDAGTAAPSADDLEIQSKASGQVAADPSAFASLDLTRLVELLVVSVKDRAARCRVLGSESLITLRAGRIWHLVPGEIAVIRPRKQWRYRGHPYLSGEIESTRLDAAALGLVPLQLRDEGIWEPKEHYWGEEDEPIEEWAKPIIAKGPRPEFRMETILPGEDADDPFWDPITEAADLKDAGNYQDAQKILMDLCEADLRCLDAHAHLGNLVFDHFPNDAIRHYAAGLGIGEMSLGVGFDGLLPWGYIDNRPFLRCMHGYGLCLWRLGRLDDAARIFTRLLWLNPSDNQGARFLIEEVRAGLAWDNLYTRSS